MNRSCSTATIILPVGLPQLWCDFDKSSTFRNQTYNESTSIPDICFYPEVPALPGVWVKLAVGSTSVFFFFFALARQHDELNIPNICSHPEGGLASDNSDGWCRQNGAEEISIMFFGSHNVQLIDGFNKRATSLELRARVESRNAAWTYVFFPEG